MPTLAIVKMTLYWKESWVPIKSSWLIGAPHSSTFHLFESVSLCLTLPCKNRTLRADCHPIPVPGLRPSFSLSFFIWFYFFISN